jgi:hypothetical protein
MSELGFWSERLDELCLRLRAAVSGSLAAALRANDPASIGRPVSTGAGDVTFGLDVPSEQVCTEWLLELARERPLSLLTEDAGWRHMGPENGEAVLLPDFAHGGPRITLDPIDGTRNLMADLRSAWTVVAFAPAGPAQPRLSEVTLGLVSELPHSRMSSYRALRAQRGEGCQILERTTADDQVVSEASLDTGDDARCDHGYFPFFRFDRSQAPRITAIECEFQRLLHEREGADLFSCYDDQYISNGGQLVLLSVGTYRFVSDLRAWVASETGTAATSSKPYDSAGAILCAREAGAVIEAADGNELDFPLDVTTPVSFVGWVNAATRARLRPHLTAALLSGR